MSSSVPTPHDDAETLRRRLERERAARREAERIAEEATSKLYGEVQRTMDELRHSQGQLSSILASVADGVIGLDASGIITFLNAASRRMLRLEPGRGLGEYLHDIAHDRDERPEDCPIFLTLSSARVRSVEYDVFRRADGGSLRVDYTCAPILMNGAAMGAVVVFRDATARSEDELVLRDHIAHLERELAKRPPP